MVPKRLGMGVRRRSARPLERAALGAFAAALPLLLVIACGVDGKTPDCSDPSVCEPTVPNPFPNAQPDTGGGETSIIVPADATTDSPAADATDAPIDQDAGDAADGAGDAPPG